MPQTASSLPRLTLTIIRHGEVSLPAPDLLYGDHDVSLSPAALAVMPRLAAVLSSTQPGLVLTSHLKRCASLARSVADLSGARLFRDARLRERHIGQWRMTPRSQHLADPVYQRFVAGDPDATPPGGESLRMLQARYMAAIQPLLPGDGAGGPFGVAGHSANGHGPGVQGNNTADSGTGGHVVWVSHGGVIRTFRCFVRGVDIADSLQFAVGYFDATEFERDESGRWHETQGPRQLLE